MDNNKKKTGTKGESDISYFQYILQQPDKKPYEKRKALRNYYTPKKLVGLMRDGKVDSTFMDELNRFLTSADKTENELLNWDELFNNVIVQILEDEQSEPNKDIKIILDMIQNHKFTLSFWLPNAIATRVKELYQESYEENTDLLIQSCICGIITFNDFRDLMGGSQALFDLYSTEKIKASELASILREHSLASIPDSDNEGNNEFSVVDFIQKGMPVNRIRDLFEAQLIDHADIRKMIALEIIDESDEEIIIGDINKLLYKAMFKSGTIESKPRTKETGKQGKNRLISRAKTAVLHKDGSCNWIDDYWSQSMGFESADVQRRPGSKGIIDRYRFWGNWKRGLVVLEPKNHQKGATYIMTLAQMFNFIDKDELLENNKVIFNDGIESMRDLRTGITATKDLTGRWINHGLTWGANVICAIGALASIGNDEIFEIYSKFAHDWVTYYNNVVRPEKGYEPVGDNKTKLMQAQAKQIIAKGRRKFANATRLPSREESAELTYG